MTTTTAIARTCAAVVVCVVAALALTSSSVVAGSAAGEVTGSGERSGAPERVERPLLRLSRSGDHWRDSLRRPLFWAGKRWVPGEVRQRRFKISNRGDAGGRLQLHLTRVNRDPLLRTGYLTIATRVGHRRWVRVREPGRTLVGARGLAPGKVVRVQVRVRLARRAPGSTQRLRTRFGYRATLTDLPRRPTTRPAADGDLTPLAFLLPDTAPPWAPWAVLGLLGVGAFAGADRRHRRGARVVTGDA